MKQYIYGHNSQETAYMVEDYPWGFRLRTQIRYWVESKKGHGQRFVSQTQNPKTGAWCAPKPSTYCAIAIMYLDEKGHVQWENVHRYAQEEEINKFKETHLAHLDEFQKQSLKEIMAHAKVMKGVTCTIEMVKPGDKSREDREKEQLETYKMINKAIYFEMTKIQI